MPRAIFVDVQVKMEKSKKAPKLVCFVFLIQFDVLSQNSLAYTKNSTISWDDHAQKDFRRAQLIDF